MIAFANDQLEILYFGKKRDQGFLTQLRDHFRWRRETREYALGDFDCEIGQNQPDLISDHLLCLAEARKNPRLHRTHFRAKFNEPTVHARISLARTFAAAPFELGRKFCRRELPHGFNRFGSQHERSGERNRMT